MRRADQRIEARAAQPVVHGARRLDRQARQQQRVAGDVAAVLAGLAGAADRHVVDDLGREARARHHLLDDAGQQVVGAHARQRSGMAAERRAQSIVDVGFEHGRGSPRATVLERFAPAAALDQVARRVCRLVHLGPAQGEHQLGHDGDGDLLRALRADVDADRRVDARDLVVAEAGRLQALGALGVVAPGAERADVEAVRAHGELERLVVDVADVGQRHHRRVGVEADLGDACPAAIRCRGGCRGSAPRRRRPCAGRSPPPRSRRSSRAAPGSGRCGWRR